MGNLSRVDMAKLLKRLILFAAELDEIVTYESIGDGTNNNNASSSPENSDDFVIVPNADDQAYDRKWVWDEHFTSNDVAKISLFCFISCHRYNNKLPPNSSPTRPSTLPISEPKPVPPSRKISRLQSPPKVRVQRFFLSRWCNFYENFFSLVSMFRVRQHQVEFHVRHPLTWNNRIVVTAIVTATSIRYHHRVYNSQSELHLQIQQLAIDVDRHLDVVDLKRRPCHHARGKLVHQPPQTSISHRRRCEDLEQLEDRPHYHQVPSLNFQLCQVQRFWLRTTTIRWLVRELLPCPIWEQLEPMASACFITIRKMPSTTIQWLSTRPNYQLRLFWT